MADSTPYKVPAEPGRWRAITLAATVHAALFAMLWIGVRWQNETPVAVEAEIWSPEVREAAPRPEPEPEPVSKPEPKPEPKPIVKEVPKPVVKPKEEPPLKDPAIALEQERKRKALEQKRIAEAKQREKEKEIAKAEAEKKKAEAIKQAKAEAAADKKRKQEQADAKAKQLVAEKAAADRRHKENLERLLAQAGSGGTGEAAKSQAGSTDTGYRDRIGSKIKSNTIFSVPPGLADNPAVEYTIDLLPDGSLRGVRKLKSSGVPGFDEAVARAIERSQPYPADQSGRVPSSLTISHKPKDQ